MDAVCTPSRVADPHDEVQSRPPIVVDVPPPSIVQIQEKLREAELKSLPLLSTQRMRSGLPSLVSVEKTSDIPQEEEFDEMRSTLDSAGGVQPLVQLNSHLSGLLVRSDASRRGEDPLTRSVREQMRRTRFDMEEIMFHEKERALEAEREFKKEAERYFILRERHEAAYWESKDRELAMYRERIKAEIRRLDSEASQKRDGAMTYANHKKSALLRRRQQTLKSIDGRTTNRMECLAPLSLPASPVTPMRRIPSDVYHQHPESRGSTPEHSGSRVSSPGFTIRRINGAVSPLPTPYNSNTLSQSL